MTRVTRPIRTTRRTAEQQQGGGGGVLGGMFGASSRGDGQLAGISSSGAFFFGGGGISHGSVDASGGSSSLYGNRRRSSVSRDKPARRWIQVRRPPAPGAGFLVSLWVPVDCLTEAERSTYLPPSQEQAAISEANSDGSTLVRETPHDPSGSPDASAVADANAMEVEPLTMRASASTAAAAAAAEGPDASDEVGSDRVQLTSSEPQNLAPPSTHLSARHDPGVAATSTANVPETEAFQSPNERPTKRARFEEGASSLGGSPEIAANDEANDPGPAAATGSPDLALTVMGRRDADVDASVADREVLGEAATIHSPDPQRGYEDPNAGTAVKRPIGDEAPGETTGPRSTDGDPGAGADGSDRSESRAAKRPRLLETNEASSPEPIVKDPGGLPEAPPPTSRAAAPEGAPSSPPVQLLAPSRGEGGATAAREPSSIRMDGIDALPAELSPPAGERSEMAAAGSTTDLHETKEGRAQAGSDPQASSHGWI